MSAESTVQPRQLGLYLQYLLSLVGRRLRSFHLLPARDTSGNWNNELHVSDSRGSVRSRYNLLVHHRQKVQWSCH